MESLLFAETLFLFITLTVNTFITISRLFLFKFFLSKTIVKMLIAISTIKAHMSLKKKIIVEAIRPIKLLLNALESIIYIR